MIRRILLDAHTSGEPGFRWRGHEVTRLEGFTDAVFAFAVTLLVVSLEVPKSFTDLMQAMQGFVVFGICFGLLAFVWYQHYRFFRRYGLENPLAVFLNCALLFFVLFYVYPLKFVFTAVFSRVQYSEHEGRMLYTIFGLGFTAVYGVFALLYLQAWRRRDELALTAIERLRTRQSLADQLAMVLLGLASMLEAQLLPTRWIGSAGLIYSLIPVYYTIAGRFWGQRERRVQQIGPELSAR